jgi:CheY-like chemotaxis protein
MSETKRVLIIDDEPDHLLAMQMIFEKEDGLQVETAGDSQQADEILRKGGVDLILLDIALPGETGMEFCARQPKMDGVAKIPIIAVSAFPDSIWREKALQAGCIDFFSKPFDPPKLVELVRKTLNLR